MVEPVEPTPGTETAGQPTWKDRLFRTSAQVRQWELVNQVLGQSRQRNLIQRLAEIQQNAYAEKVGATAPALREVEDVQFGDNPVTINAPQQGGVGKWAALIGAAILGSGVAGGIALNRYLSGDGPDLNTQYELQGDFEPAPAEIQQ